MKRDMWKETLKENREGNLKREFKKERKNTTLQHEIRRKQIIGILKGNLKMKFKKEMQKEIKQEI